MSGALPFSCPLQQGRVTTRQALRVDFFTVETIWLQQLYVLFFIELASRRVHVAGCTPKSERGVTRFSHPTRSQDREMIATAGSEIRGFVLPINSI
jgi:hypothetical protein